jgi:acetyl esterase/lipase
LDGQTATYPEVSPDEDVVLSALPDGYEMSVVVKAPPLQPVVLELPLDTGGLTATMDEQGRISLLDEAGVEVAFADQAIMWDAATDEAGDPARQSSVPAELIDTGEGYELTLRPDPSFFTDPAAVYPVTIDPTSSFSANLDTHMRTDNPTTTYGGSTVLKSGSPDGTQITRSLIRFGAGALAYKQIDAATLGLYQVEALSCTATEVDVYEAADEFSNSTTWNTQLPIGPLYASASAAHGYTGCATPGWVMISTGGDGGLGMIDLVQGWADGDSNNGVMLRAASETSTSGYKKFNSADAGSNVPTLSVTFQDADVNELLSDPTIDQASADAIADTDPTAVDPETFADCPAPLEEYPMAPGGHNVQYESTKDLHLDVYVPPGLPTPTIVHYAAMIMVHGGGWDRGCKTNIQKEASIASGSNEDGDYGLPEQFLVFNINYRLSCTASDPYLSLATEENGEVDSNDNLCGWDFQDTDTTGHDGEDHGAAVHDVEDAIEWVKGNVNDWCPPNTPAECWNGNVELFGNSAGGNLAYEAAGRMYEYSSSNPYQVQAIGAWSGAPRMDLLEDGHWPCAPAETSKANNCRGAQTKYTGCLANYPPQSQGCIDIYGDASPYSHFLDPGLPKAFFANGTPYGKAPPAPLSRNREVSSMNAVATDFRGNLNNNQWAENGTSDTGSFMFCSVYWGADPVDLHARNYAYDDDYDFHCDGETDSVYVTMITYLESAVT